MKNRKASVRVTRNGLGQGPFGWFSAPARRYVSGYLLFLLLLCAAFHVRYILNNPIWSEYDEIANYDYIERLGRGQLPHAEDYITDYSAEITFRFFSWQETQHFDGTKETMGAASRSYQAHQPPLYFLMLAPVNLALKAAGVSPLFQITFLRLINVPLGLAACAVTILVFRELNLLFGWDPIYGYYIAVFSYVFGFHFRSHVGADMLSPLVGAVFFYLLLRQWRTGNQVYATFSALAAALCFLTKYTHALFPIFWAVSMLFYYKKHPGLRLRNRILHFVPYSIVGFYFLVNIIQYGIDDPLRTGATKGLFSWVPQVLDAWYVVYQFVTTSFYMDSMPMYGNLFAVAVVGLLVFNYALSFYRLFIERQWSVVPIFGACQISVTLILAALVLNAYRTGVFWWTFRIYFGYTIPWFVALTAAPYLVRWKPLRAVWGVAGLVLLTVLVIVRAQLPEFGV